MKVILAIIFCGLFIFLIINLSNPKISVYPTCIFEGISDKGLKSTPYIISKCNKNTRAFDKSYLKIISLSQNSFSYIFMQWDNLTFLEKANLINELISSGRVKNIDLLPIWMKEENVLEFLKLAESNKAKKE